MIKVFTLNKNNKIELTKDELEQLLNESFWEGYNKNSTYVYRSPFVSTPYVTTRQYTVDCDTISNSATIKAADLYKNDNKTGK